MQLQITVALLRLVERTVEDVVVILGVAWEQGSGHLVKGVAHTIRLRLTCSGCRQEIQRNGKGEPIFPISVKGASVECLGEIVFTKPNFHSKKYIWPAGFSR